MTSITKTINGTAYGFSAKSYSDIFNQFIFIKKDEKCRVIIPNFGYDIEVDLSIQSCVDMCNKEDEKLIEKILQQTPNLSILQLIKK